ncbi:holo-ACP synthase [Latilactobacillus fuchuensis]|jgi:holo-[acyl-carrier protein] synthase|uniref:Holo-[acyl-carrier-protein] synthase n=2 Tax=Latilactobacillus fuchuensis TaxID=164393 RepID=A0A2N9DTG4_9LACO|nr:holo-ACP synthase [Latilactobacillus fuchuensis]KRL61067.1 holo-[acyl-carrier-protein] synthase [Latilactobacillus fuchuensis DSM 14340 = JCM 11249]MCP8857255.1 holo-ACP synthase [Latilactobacillus fuchuensis]SPC36851.1 holo-acyl carrier protein synthase [Latilactobacillus fuchuensis]
MIIGLGVDLAEIARFEKAQTKNAHFAQKVLTPTELALFNSYSPKHALEFLAGRYAVKEAFSKAYGTGIGQVGLQDVETLNDAHGKPYIRQSLFDGTVHVSLSHTDTLVIAEVILERG